MSSSIVVRTHRSKLTLGGYIKALRRMGYKHCGTGADARAYVSADGGHVLKVGYKRPMAAYLRYLSHAGAGVTDNPWVPKVYDILQVTPPEVGHDYTVVAMERLYSAGRKSSRVSNSLNDIVRHNLRSASVKRLVDEVTSYSSQPGIDAVVGAIKKARNSSDYDLHDGNIMVRRIPGQSMQFVVTDPLH